MMLAASEESCASRSGYTVLADYVSKRDFVGARRSEPRGLFQRAVGAVLSRTAAARWYRIGSAKLEWRAWRLSRDFDGVLHLMWADRDWGFIDLLRNKVQHKLCFTFHGCPDTLPETIQFPSRLRALDAIILMSTVQREFFESNGISPERIHVIPHGVDCDFFRPPTTRPDSPFTVLSVGNYRRNFPLLLEVSERLEAHRNIRFKVIAPLGRRGLFTRQKNVEFISGINDDALRKAYQEASCLLMTVESATANNAVLEAMACGLPIVSENVGGISEYTGDQAARLCPAGDGVRLAETVLQLQQSPTLRDEMARASRVRAETFAWPIVATKTESLYRQLLTCPNGYGNL